MWEMKERFLLTETSHYFINLILVNTFQASAFFRYP